MCSNPPIGPANNLCQVTIFCGFFQNVLCIMQIEKAHPKERYAMPDGYSMNSFVTYHVIFSIYRDIFRSMAC